MIKEHCHVISITVDFIQIQYTRVKQSEIQHKYKRDYKKFKRKFFQVKTTEKYDYCSVILSLLINHQFVIKNVHS